MTLLTPKQIVQLDELGLQNLHARMHSYFRQLISGEKKFNREELVNQKIFVLEEMRRRDMKHKVRDELDEEALTLLNKSSFPAWLASFPEKKEALWELQDKLGFNRNEKADNDGIHCTIALFDDLDEISKIKVALEKADIKEFEFISIGLNAYGKDLNAIVLEGTMPDKLQELIEKFRSKFDDTEYAKQYLPHITLGYADEQAFNLLSLGELDKIADMKIKMSKPVLMVSIQKDEQIITSFLQEDEDELENELSRNLGTLLEKKLDKTFEEELRKVKELVVIYNVCSVTGSSALPDKEADDIDLVWRMEFDDEGYARIDLRNLLMKFDRAFSNEVSDQFHHISSLTGPNWSFIPIMDLVLRFKNSNLDITHIEESYAYHKAMADVPGVGAEWLPETFPDKKTARKKFHDYLSSWLKEHKDKAIDYEELFDIMWDAFTVPKSKSTLGTGLGVTGERMGTGGTSYCYCHECNIAIIHQRGIPCNEFTCSICGKQMTGVNPEDLQRLLYNIFDKQRLKEVQLMKPFKPIKSRVGLYEYEFFVGEEDVMWRTFARPIIEG